MVNIHTSDAAAAAVNPTSPAVMVPPISRIIEITMAPNAPATSPLPKPLSTPPPTMSPTTMPAMNNPMVIPIKPKKNPKTFENITANINPTNAAAQLTNTNHPFA